MPFLRFGDPFSAIASFEGPRAMATKANPAWPVLATYEGAHLAQVALPIGGIGTGTVSLGGRGELRDWELVNRPAKGFAPAHSFFALYAKPAGRPPVTRLLEGLLPPPYEGDWGCTVPNHGRPRGERHPRGNPPHRAKQQDASVGGGLRLRQPPELHRHGRHRRRPRGQRQLPADHQPAR
ncbi:MAG: GH116 family glycosyl-hydrolase [Planctomycetota bacterium]